jgi:hypothetical protein
VRDGGGIYWVPSVYAAELRRLQGAVEKIGTSRVHVLTIRTPPSVKETAMQIDCGTLRRALKNLVQLEPKQPMPESVLFEPTHNDVTLTGTDITTQTVIATATISPFTS